LNSSKTLTVTLVDPYDGWQPEPWDAPL